MPLQYVVLYFWTIPGTDSSDSSIHIYLKFDINVLFSTCLYHKRGDFNLTITYCPHIDCNIPTTRPSSFYSDFLHQPLLSTQQLSQRCYEWAHLIFQAFFSEDIKILLERIMSLATDDEQYYWQLDCVKSWLLFSYYVLFCLWVLYNIWWLRPSSFFDRNNIILMITCVSRRSNTVCMMLKIRMLFVPFRFAIILSVLFRFTSPNYIFGIFKLFLQQRGSPSYV